MNILLVTPLFSSSHFDAGHFGLKALSALGHLVSVWDYRLSLCPPYLTQSVHYDLALVLKGESVDPDMVKSFADKVVCYWPDKLERTPGIEKVLERYDNVFTPVRPTPDWMVWLPTGYDADIHRDLVTRRYLESVYIGTANSEYKELMVSGIRPSRVFGNGWGIDTPVYLHDFVYVANQYKVLIDIHQAPDCGVNRKFFELIPCGFTIVDDVPGVREILGEELAGKVVYHSVEDAKRMICYYCDHEIERDELWIREKKAIQPYTYRNAVRAILNES